MLPKIIDFITQHHLLEQGDKVLLGVSGGPDSIALLHVLAGLKPEFGLDLHVAHFNHMFRGQQADEEALFVQQFAQALDIPCTVKVEDVPGYLKEQSLSAQEGARLLRYRFFYALSAELGFAKIALGHHADDQAETVILHLLRGGGTRGLAGMSPQRGLVIRPLLGVTRQEIEAYCRENQLEYRTDPTNFKTIYTRNKIRLELLPLLKQNYNPKILQTLNQTAEILRLDDDLLEKMTLQAYADHATRPAEGQVVLDKGAYFKLHPALRRRLIRHIYAVLAGNKDGLQFNYVREIERFITAGMLNKKMGLPRGIVLKIQKAAIIFSKLSPARAKLAYEKTLLVPGMTTLPGGLTIEAEEIPLAKAQEAYLAAKQDEAFVDLAKIKLPLLARPRKPGDCFQPLGLEGTKKLKDFFIDLKVPGHKRDTIPVIADSSGLIVWVAGLRIDDRFKLEAETRKVLYLRLRPRQEDSWSL